ncbi:WNT11 protein, partial [Calcarius ornatus]|nr:WNT11 protein [Calcarius ornatus]
ALSKTSLALALNQTQHCKQLEGLVVSQVQLCRSNLELMQTIIQAAREVIKTCRKTFSDMRWNCSSIELAPNYLLDLDRGTRESAFVYALSAAAISHTIARACTTGDLPGCSCGPIPGETPGPGYRWGGCADNLNYGLIMGSKFSDAPMKMKKSGSQANKLMHLHNSEVGRQCWSCGEVQCLYQLAEGAGFSKIALKSFGLLKTVAVCIQQQLPPAIPAGRREDFFSFLNCYASDYSHIWHKLLLTACIQWRDNIYHHFPSSRQCNKTSNGSDSCDLMCCGRGYNPYMDKVVERCHCKYHWCCYVTCKKCERTVERYVCK